MNLSLSLNGLLYFAPQNENEIAKYTKRKLGDSLVWGPECQRVAFNITIITIANNQVRNLVVPWQSETGFEQEQEF